MTKVDLVALGFVALTAFIGWKKGLIASALSVAGIVLGAWIGSRLAPELLQGGTHSPYTPLAALAGAAGGAILGAVAGLAVVWVLGAVALLLPGQTNLRHDAQASALLRRLNAVIPPTDLLNALARIDPFPAITGPAAPV